MKNFLVILFLIVVIALLNTLIGGAAGQALASLFVAIVLLIGKGDFLIAGYNTASQEEKDKCNIKRLRLITASVFLLLSALLAFKDAIGDGLFIAATLLFVVVAIILANTWGMKKDK